MVFVGDVSIAVTSRNSNTINIFDLKNQKLKKSIKINTHNVGVVYKDGHLIYCAGEKRLQVVTLSDEFITNVSNNKKSSFAYVTTFCDNLLFTNSDNHSVNCCDYHGIKNTVDVL